jgi:aspartyl-tRNA(Asn)/glutamyl-tRNA(Gln) amidotransferase subunit A
MVWPPATFTAREVAEGFNAAVADAAALNAFIVTTPDHALAAADAVDASARRVKSLAPMGGVPIGMKDLFATHGVQTTAASHILEGFTPQYESTVSQKLWDAGAGMLGKLNLDQFAMGSSNETSYFGNVANRLAQAKGSNASDEPRRFLGRILRSGGGADRAGGDGHRYRRIDPPARGLHRHLRDQADLWPLLALGRGGVCLQPRSGRVRWPAVSRIARSCWARWPVSTPRMRPASMDVPDWEGALNADLKGQARRHPEANTGWRAPMQAILDSWEQGKAWLKDAGAEIVDISLPHTKYALPAYYIIAPAEASSATSRAMTACAMGCAICPMGPACRICMPPNARSGLWRRGEAPHPDRHLCAQRAFTMPITTRRMKVRTLVARDFEAAFGRIAT